MRGAPIRWLLWVGGLVLGLGVLLWSTRPLIEVASGTPTPDDAVALAAAGAAWLVCGWLLLATAAALVEATLATLGGRLGQAGWPERLARRVAPSSVRTAIQASLGTGLAVTALTGVGIAGVGMGSAPAQATTATASYSPRELADGQTSSQLPSVDRPATGARSDDPPHDDRRQPYPVRPGDTLWGIAAVHLPGRPTSGAIARAWPLWWQANRSVIGDDPNLIRPGQVLRAPR